MALTLFSRTASPQGNPLGPEFRVSTTTFGDQYASSLAADASGNIVVTWTSWGQDGPDFAVYGQRYDGAGVPVGQEFRINTYTTDHQNRPSIVVHPTGSFVVTWSSREQDGSILGVFAQRFASSSAPLGAEFRVNTYTTGYQFQQAIAANEDGFVVIWTSREQDGSGDGVFGQRFAASGTPQGPEFRVTTFTSSEQSDPAVAALPGGGFVVVWADIQPQDFGQGIFGRRYSSSGVPIGPEFHVNTYTLGNQRFPAIAADPVAAGPSANFVVVWQGDMEDGWSYGIFGQRYASSGVPLGPEFRVNTFTTAMQFWPRIAADPAGDFIVAWSGDQQDGSTSGIFGQRFSSSGAPLGSEFRVNTYTTSYQTLATVAADTAGKFLVVWTSFGQDGSASGLYGQRYAPILPVELMHIEVK